MDTPRSLGPYTLLAPLAAGGMGEVYLGCSQPLAGAVRLVAVKVMREGAQVARFLDEARVAMQLTHANIGQILDVGSCKGVHFIAMEHIAGVSIRKIVDAQPVPQPLALFVGAELLDALAFAHERTHALTGSPLHVVHRDVSAHNVMISFEGEVKLIDFGLAQSELSEDETVGVVGSVAYMAPEQARGRRALPASDQFAAAVVLYEMLTGERFFGERKARHIWRILEASRPYLPPGLERLDVDVARLLQRGLAWDPAGRFRTCGDFAQAVRVVLELNHPLTDRTRLRSFVRAAGADELLRWETSRPGLGARLLAAPRAAADATLSLDAGSTSPWGLPVLRHALAGRKHAGAVLGLLLGSAVFVAYDRVSAALPRTVDDDPAPVESVAPADDDDGVTFEVMSVGAPARVVAATIAAPNVAEPTVAPPPRPRPRPASRPRGPAWQAWTFEKKLSALRGCDARCAKTLVKLKNNGTKLLDAAMDACLDVCD